MPFAGSLLPPLQQRTSADSQKRHRQLEHRRRRSDGSRRRARELLAVGKIASDVFRTLCKRLAVQVEFGRGVSQKRGFLRDRLDEHAAHAGYDCQNDSGKPASASDID